MFLVAIAKLEFKLFPQDVTPLGSIALNDVQSVEVIDPADQSDAEDATGEQEDHAYFALHMRDLKPEPSAAKSHVPDSYYFEALSRHEMEKWVYHLMVNYLCRKLFLDGRMCAGRRQ